MDNRKRKRQNSYDELNDSASHQESYSGTRSSRYRRPKRELLSSKGVYFTTDAYGSVQVNTDGACRKDRMGNTIAAIGVCFGRFHPLNTGRVIPNIYDNNVAEMGAAAEAIKIAKAHNIKDLTIKTDSMYVIETIENMRVNRNRCMESSAYKLCPGLIKHILKQFEVMTVQWQWVKGHNGDEGNTNADYLAEEALVDFGLPPHGCRKRNRK